MLDVVTFSLDPTWTSIIDTIIPTTDTLGAKDLGLDILVEKIIIDCYPQEVQKLVFKGIEMVNKSAIQSFNRTFINCTEYERVNILERLETAEKIYNLRIIKDNKRISSNPDPIRQLQFFHLIKELTVLCYLKSEYVTKNITGFSKKPIPYRGCVAI
jgi:Gluconate 2-dehydrogenase subunit 3